MKNFTKYRPFPRLEMKNRKWPNNTITKAPIWCSVDLRDGNQSLEIPMNLEQKINFFKFLVKIGFKEIEIGFPAASDTEFEFARHIIENNLIPEGVTVQVLTQSRNHIIKKTFEAVKGAKNVIVHLYNSTSTLQRDVVFGNSKAQTTELAIFGAEMIISEAKNSPETNFIFQYSPESFTGTEIDYAAEICNAVIETWKPATKNKIIINLPATVEMSTPNIYADQIEYMCENLIHRDSITISLHTHNDRGTGVAATELALMAGADRVEGTLFGNGERTGNADIITLAMNLFTQGIDPELDLTNINEIIAISEKSTNLPVHPRHPYAGTLVFTAFSGSHQDAIKKGMDKIKDHPEEWAVPYLPLDPVDVGRNYDPIIRINSQSGKGGVSFILEQAYGLFLPKMFQQDFGMTVTKVSDEKNSDLTPSEIYELFNSTYVDIRTPLKLVSYKEEFISENCVKIHAEIEYNNQTMQTTGEGNGIIAALCDSLAIVIPNFKFEIQDYREHSMSVGTNARAISYIQAKNGGETAFFGAGTSSNITKSSLRAVISAVNKMIIFKENN